MAFDNTYTAVTGATYTASDYNTYTKSNFSALWVGSTAGDLDYYSSATAKARLALVTGGLLYGGASAPAWLALVTGGLLYGGASAPTWLAGGTQGKFLGMGATYPEWASLLHRRQGGSATDWNAAGTTVYTPDTQKIQVGVVSVSVATSGSATVTFPVSFTNKPVIYFSPQSEFGNITCVSEGVTNSSFSLRLRDVTTSGSITVYVHWIAIGD